jgi:hypothetical protein
MTYCGQPPHGGYPLRHHELCLGDCGHWDCLGCCGCPSDDGDVDTVETLQDQGFGHEWIADWYASQIRKAKTQGASDERTRISEGYERILDQMFHSEPSDGYITIRREVLLDIRRLVHDGEAAHE